MPLSIYLIGIQLHHLNLINPFNNILDFRLNPNNSLICFSRLSGYISDLSGQSSDAFRVSYTVLDQREFDKFVSQLRDFSCLWQVMKLMSCRKQISETGFFSIKYRCETPFFCSGENLLDHLVMFISFH